MVDEYAFIAHRMETLDTPAAYDLGGPGPDALYRGPIIEDVGDIGLRLRALEAARNRRPAAGPCHVPTEADTDWWCC
jgi:hypothetical protein